VARQNCCKTDEHKVATRSENCGVDRRLITQGSWQCCSLADHRHASSVTYSLHISWTVHHECLLLNFYSAAIITIIIIIIIIKLASTHIFYPFAIETAGTWHEMAIELTQETGRRRAISPLSQKTSGRQHSFSNAFPWLFKEEMRFLSTTPWWQSKLPLQP